MTIRATNNSAQVAGIYAVQASRILEPEVSAEEESTETTIQDLPAEVLLHAFSYLPLSDVPTIALVCRYWQCLIADKQSWNERVKYSPHCTKQMYQKYQGLPIEQKTAECKRITAYGIRHNLRRNLFTVSRTPLDITMGSDFMVQEKLHTLPAFSPNPAGGRRNGTLAIEGAANRCPHLGRIRVTDDLHMHVLTANPDSIPNPPGERFRFIEEGNRLFTRHPSGVIHEWDTRNLSKSFCYISNTLDLARQPTEFASTELAKLIHVRTYAGHTNPAKHRSRIRTLAVSGNHLYSAGHDGLIKKWNMTTGECLHVFQLPPTASGITRLTFPNCAYILKTSDHLLFSVSSGPSVSYGPMIKIWDLKKDECLHTIKVDDDVKDVSISGIAIDENILYAQAKSDMAGEIPAPTHLLAYYFSPKLSSAENRENVQFLNAIPCNQLPSANGLGPTRLRHLRTADHRLYLAFETQVRKTARNEDLLNYSYFELKFDFEIEAKPEKVLTRLVEQLKLPVTQRTLDVGSSFNILPLGMRQEIFQHFIRVVNSPPHRRTAPLPERCQYLFDDFKQCKQKTRTSLVIAISERVINKAIPAAIRAYIAELAPQESKAEEMIL